MVSSFVTLPSELIGQICENLDRKSILSLRHTNRFLAIHTTHALIRTFERIAVTCSITGLMRLNCLTITSDDDPSADLKRRSLANIRRVTLHLLTPHALQELAASLLSGSVGERYLRAYEALHDTLTGRLNEIPCPWILEVTNEHLNGAPGPDIWNPAYQSDDDRIQGDTDIDYTYPLEAMINAARSLVKMDSMELHINYDCIPNWELLRKMSWYAYDNDGSDRTMFGFWPHADILHCKLKKLSLGGWISEVDIQFWHRTSSKLTHLKFVDTRDDLEDADVEKGILEMKTMFNNNTETLQEVDLVGYRNNYTSWGELIIMLRDMSQLENLTLHDCLALGRTSCLINVRVCDGKGRLSTCEAYGRPASYLSLPQTYHGSMEEILHRLEETIIMIGGR